RHTELVVGPSASITIEEYPIVVRSVDQPGHFEYNERLTEQMKSKRDKWRGQDGGHRVIYLNEKLAPTGYKLVETATDIYDLYKGDELIRSGLNGIYEVAVSDDGKNFAFVANAWEPTAMLVTSAGTRPWDMQEHIFMPPAFAGNDLIEIKTDDQRSRFVILRGGQEIYQGDLPPTVADYPVKGFFGWNGQWVVELKGDVIIDGKSLKSHHGYNEVFDWQLIDGKPFYFYRIGEKVGISYDGRHQGAQYDEVMHYMCCEPAAFNPMGNGTMLWFHARRGETWYYVEAGVYK
ncbi:MAG: hypothetical protein K0R39_4696, partial [Symbiobacteriaceae bacterium]|nr:hypothetical protein [Symbiobacteriaceae bacterium]